jgi:osmotically inducible protein OsmC
VRGEVPGITAEAFQQAANEAKDGCPVSNALAGNVAITLELR